MAHPSALAIKRRSRGHTQETLAHYLGVDVSSVARWERGAAQPSPRVRRALAGELGLSLAQLAQLLPATPSADPSMRSGSWSQRREPTSERAPELITDRWGVDDQEALVAYFRAEPAGVLNGEHAVRVAHQWLITPAPPTVAETREDGERTRRIGESTLERLRARVRYLRHADDVVAGGDLHTTIRNELATTAGLLRTTTYTEDTGRDLLRALGELAELAGWSTADAGHTSTAEHYYVHGIQAAHAADDPVLAAHLVSNFGYHIAETGTAPREAVLVTRSALAQLQSLDHHDVTPSVRALLRARTAWAHAAAGELHHAADESQRAQDDYNRRGDTDPDPPWIYWLTPAEMDIILGRLDTVLGKPEQAQRRLGAAVQHCDPRRVRETALYTTWLAHAHLQVDDTDRAHSLAAHARRLDATIPSAYSNRAVTHLDRALAGVGHVT